MQESQTALGGLEKPTTTVSTEADRSIPLFPKASTWMDYHHGIMGPNTVVKVSRKPYEPSKSPNPFVAPDAAHGLQSRPNEPWTGGRQIAGFPFARDLPSR